jgi:hypothetical protein
MHITNADVFLVFVAVVVVAVLYRLWSIRKGSKFPNAQRLNFAEPQGEADGSELDVYRGNEDDGDNNEPWTDPELIKEIRSASFDELLVIAGEYNSSAFSEEEDSAFRERADALHLTREAWGQIHQAFEGEGSVLEEFAREKAA